MESAHIVIQGADIRKIEDYLVKKEYFYYKLNTKDVVVLMKEEYYMRIKSNLLSVYILSFKDDTTVEIEMIVGGGQLGASGDWGAERSENRKIAQSIIEICNQNSWSILEVFPEEFKKSLEKTKAEKLMNSVSDWFKKQIDTE
ncbi:MAG: hypothetical protein K0Q99_2044 [Clostridia bacterium]|jgi:hypothetical protein|nr:hypothetical protein [Clostridia bacterium]